MSLHSKVATWAIMSLIVISTSSQASEREIKPKVSNQLMCLAKNVYYEAGLETRDGMVAVAQVTMNRTEDSKFPKTVCAVVNQKTQITVPGKDRPMIKTVCQFSWVCNAPVPIRYVSDRWAQSLAVAEEVMLRDTQLDQLTEALYFHNLKAHPNWGLERVAKIGNHIFYSDDPAPRRRRTNG